MGSLRNTPSDEHGRALKYSATYSRNQNLSCTYLRGRDGVWRCATAMLQPSLLRYCFYCASSSYVLSNLLESGSSLNKQNRQKAWEIRCKAKIAQIGGQLSSRLALIRKKKCIISQQDCWSSTQNMCRYAGRIALALNALNSWPSYVFKCPPVTIGARTCLDRLLTGYGYGTRCVVLH